MHPSLPEVCKTRTGQWISFIKWDSVVTRLCKDCLIVTQIDQSLTQTILWELRRPHGLFPNNQYFLVSPMEKWVPQFTGDFLCFNYRIKLLRGWHGRITLNSTKLGLAQKSRKIVLLSCDECSEHITILQPLICTHETSVYLQKRLLPAIQKLDTINTFAVPVPISNFSSGLTYTLGPIVTGWLAGRSSQSRTARIQISSLTYFRSCPFDVVKHYSKRRSWTSQGPKKYISLRPTWWVAAAISCLSEQKNCNWEG